MSKVLTSEDRNRIAEKLGISAATLYQSMTCKGAGYSPKECVRIERDSDQELRRWDLRPRDWHEIWPELIGAEGAPKVSRAARISKKPTSTRAERPTAKGRSNGKGRA
jgi:DNA-binding transcriptional regulator YdaS (Cro superfamily)